MVVYKTTNMVNGKIYVGKYEGDRESYLGSGYILKKAIKKYGKENFKREIIERCNSIKELIEKEKYWIKTLDCTNPKIGYNVAEGGTGGNTYLGKSEEEMIEIKRKISESGKGRTFSEEHKKKLSESAKTRKGDKACKFKGMKYDEYMSIEKAETIKSKISNSLKGRKMRDTLGEEAARLRYRKISESIKETANKRHLELVEKYKILNSDDLNDRQKCNLLETSYPTYLKIKKLAAELNPGKNI